MMREKLNDMMNSDGKDDLMKKMGGKQAMYGKMGMIKGKDRDGNDMRKKFDDAMERRKGQQGGAPSEEDMMKMKKERGEKGQSYNGGCAESLCCGHVLEFGVWKEEYFCY